MGCMAKHDMRIRREAVDADPGDLNTLVSVSNDLLYLRFFGCQLGVTEHAFANRRNARGIANIGADMTIDTLHSQLHVSVVRKCDRLLPCADCAKSKEPYTACHISNSLPVSQRKQYCIFSKAV